MRANLFFMSTLLFIANYAKADDSVPVQLNVQQCTRCHTESPDYKRYFFPRLAGQTSDYLVSAMQAYKTHKRTKYVAQKLMWDKVNITDDQIQVFANYFSKLPANPGIPSTDASALAAGKKLFQEGVPENNVYACTMCHGDNAEGAGSTPRLAGQYKYYFLNQMSSYQKGEVTDDQGMSDIAKGLTETQLDALGTYLQSLN